MEQLKWHVSRSQGKPIYLVSWWVINSSVSTYSMKHCTARTQCNIITSVDMNADMKMNYWNNGYKYWVLFISWWNNLLHCAILQQHHVPFNSISLNISSLHLSSPLLQYLYSFLFTHLCILSSSLLHSLSFHHSCLVHFSDIILHTIPPLFLIPSLSILSLSSPPGIESEWIKGYEDAMLALGEQSFPLNLVFRRGLMHALSDTGASVAQGSLVRSFVCVYLCACLCVCVCVCVYLCVCVCMHVYVMRLRLCVCIRT